MKLTEDERALAESNRGIAGEAAMQLSRFAHCQAGVEDFVGIGFLAVCKAAHNWRPDGPAKFSTYAWHCCYRAILEHVYERGLIRTPREKRHDPRRIKQPRRISLTSHELAVRPVIDPVERGELHRAIDGLGPRERRIMKLSLGGLNLAEIGRELGFTRERIRQIQVRSTARLRSQLNGEVSD
jgi:RNA polymerase sigma factor (sigma-70 family)